MKKKLWIFFSATIVLTLVGASLWRLNNDNISKQVPVITLQESDLTGLGLDPARWSDDLSILTSLFESFEAPAKEQSATEQVASIPPEIYVIGPSLTALRRQVLESKQKAQELAALLTKQTMRPELFLPIRALAYTHLVLLSKTALINIDIEEFDPEVRELASAVLDSP